MGKLTRKHRRYRPGDLSQLSTRLMSYQLAIAGPVLIIDIALPMFRLRLLLPTSYFLLPTSYSYFLLPNFVLQLRRSATAGQADL